MKILFRKHRPKVGFLVIGTQKGGTSALDYYLRQHPEIGMGLDKELHFFDRDENFDTPKPDYSSYEKRFERKSKAVTFGETTPIYLYWEAAAERIKAYNPDIKLIAVLRNPVRRAFSHWNMEFDRGKEQRPFSEAINYEIQNPAGGRQHRVFSYLDRGLYAVQIERFQRLFPPEQLYFIKYEDFKKRQEGCIQDIFSFLNLPGQSLMFEEKKIHARPHHAAMDEADEQKLMAFFTADIEKVGKLLDWDCRDWLNQSTTKT